MAVPVKRFNWVRSASTWEQFQSWQERRRAMREAFETASTTALTGFATAWSNQITGKSDLAADAALKRTSQAIQAKIDTIV